MAFAVIGTVLAALGVLLALPSFRRERSSTSVERFRSQRREISAHRGEHISAAASLFAEDLRLEGTCCVSSPAWRLPNPVPLSDVNITFVEQRKRPRVSGRSRNALRLLPRTPGGARATTYSDVITNDSELRPGLWWDAASYDLLEFVPRDGRVAITCSLAQYFEMFDVCEALAHEFVARHEDRHRPNLRRLRLRDQVGDVFDLSARPFVPSVPTLVLFRLPVGPPTFFLHGRDTEAVATVSGVKHVFGGQFQPSTRHSMNPGSEADLWLSMARELAEEVLGAAHADGNAGGQLTFEDEPLRSLENFRQRGVIQAWLLGLGIDPLTLWPELLTVVVIDELAFSARFPDLPTVNAEGVVLGKSTSGAALRGFTFDSQTVEQLTAGQGLHPPAAACIRLAWRHRDALLGAATAPEN